MTKRAYAGIGSEPAKAFDALMQNLQSLSALELRTLNRYHLHPLDKRCCSSCRKIFDGIEENFHVKKHTSSGVSYNVKCASCFNQTNRKRIAIYRQSPEKFIQAKFASYRSRAASMGLSFNITKEHLLQLWSEQEGRCFYIGEEIDFTLTTDAGDHPHLLTPSLDRKDPNLGYTIGNVVWCSYGINRMKNNLDYETFIRACRLVLKTRGEYI